MMYMGHTLSGVLAGLLTEDLVVPGGSPVERAVYVTVVAIGALVPDLDAPGAKLSRALPPITWVLALGLEKLSEVVYELTRSRRDPESKGAHRTFTHTLVFSVLAGALLLALLLPWTGPGWAWLVGAGTTVGCLAHIAGDCCTETGCPVWWPMPIYGKRWKYVGIPKLLRFKTGQWVEKLLITPLLLLSVVGAAGLNVSLWDFVGKVATGM